MITKLDDSVAVNIPVYLLEPDPEVNGLTSPRGKFTLQLPKGWKTGERVTLKVGLQGYEIYKPWDGIISIRAADDKALEEVGIAPTRVVQLVKNPKKSSVSSKKLQKPM